MADLIDRQTLLSRLSDVEKMPEFLKRSYMDTYVRMEWLVDMIKQLPSAEPVRHGHWIDETFKPTGLVFHPYVCDQCGCHSESNFTYCPDCGARNDGE